LKTTEFIKNNKNWESILQAEPYCIKITKEFPYVILKYDQIHSDMSIDIVQECRGLIIREDTLKVCRYAFNKFFNYGEGNAHHIQWDDCVVEDKKDGSLMSIWYDEKWHISTNGTIDARNAGLQLEHNNFSTFYDLFDNVFNSDIYDTLNKDYIYTFEICSPYNKIVVPYTEIKLFHLGTRDNISLNELDINIGIEKPKVYRLNNLDECITTFKELDFKFEGYVVKDSSYNRIKVKNPSYLSVHNLKGNGAVSKRRVLEIIQQNEQDEFLNYFPEYTNVFVDVKKIYDEFVQKINKEILILNNKFETRKDLAMAVKDTSLPALLFNMYDGKVKDHVQYISEIDAKKLLLIMNIKE